MNGAVGSLINRQFVRSFSERVAAKSRSRSRIRRNHLSELEAIEACNWLKAAGFPQYSQLYEDGLFPIDISSVQEDHKFLDPDSIQALFRRLNTLNKCAKMKVENLPKKYIQPLEESDEEQCALSENWQFQLINRRWSRIPSPVEDSISVNKHLHIPEDYYPDNQFTSSHDNVFVDDNQSCSDSTRGSLSANCEENMIHNHLPVQIDEDHSTSGSRESTSCGSEKSSDLSENDKENIYCNGSERFKDSAKAILRKTESRKVKHKKMSWKTIGDGGQHVSMGLASDSLPGSKGEKSSDSSLASSPQTSCHKISQEISSDFSSLQDEESDGSQQGTPQLQQKNKVAHCSHDRLECF
ncbi:uncharacterized protein LOC143225821 [Tachypleus tridentatus]|uniref:uncharacterized protein LOC143225821 n=1 Tax=Tachypleus tridentatus TaxID=6853 RepID=UPI003FD4D5B5